MKTYDDEQLRAIEARGGHYLVLAPPGCGKTDILSERVVRARERGVPDDDMLCLTFTNRASRGMRDRVREKLGDQPCRIWVGNVHRYCSHLLWDNNLLPESTSILDDDEMADLLVRHNHDLFTTRNGSPHRTRITQVEHMDTYFTQRLLGHPRQVVFVPDNGLNRDFLVAQAAQFDPAMVRDNAMVKAALVLRQFKKEHSLISFNDLLIKAYDTLLHDKEHKLKRYSWIQVDEVQDLNALQTAIIDLLLDREAKEYTVMYLGDEQQAIFSFLGAKLEQLTALKQRCAGHILSLGTNYRSPQYLLDIFNEYAEKELGVDPALLPHANQEVPHHKHDLILTDNPSLLAQDMRVSKMIEHYLGLDDKERVAMLVPTNDAADRISNNLTAKGITHFKISGKDIFRSKSYKTLAAFFCVAANDLNRMAWARLMSGIGAVGNAIEAQRLTSELKRLMMTPTDLMRGASRIDRFCVQYATREFVFFDTETTGLNVLEDDIVQIAAFKVRAGERVVGSDFNIFLHTDREIPLHLGELENPLVEAYANNPHLQRDQGLRLFLEYVGDCPLMGHNVNYDYRILQKNVERELHERVTFDIFDSLLLAKCVYPDLRMYKLAYLIQELHLEGKNSHLADEDVAATLALVNHCYAEACGVVEAQRQFISDYAHVAQLMAPLVSLISNLHEHLYQPTRETGRDIVGEMRDTYQAMTSQHLIEPLNEKFDIFLNYIYSQWVDPESNETLFDQISNHINDMTATINEGDLVNNNLVSDRVFVMTVHKGKGLEFDNVVVLDAYDGVYPFATVNSKLNSKKESERRQAALELKEAARKFYVALSRAKKRLCVSYTGHLTPFMLHIRHHFTS